MITDKTIRELITEKSAILRNVENLGPEKASVELVELASLLSSLNSEIVEKQFILNQKKVELLQEAKSVSKAKMLSEATMEYKDWFERYMQGKALEELLGAVKYYLRSAEAEYREFTK